MSKGQFGQQSQRWTKWHTVCVVYCETHGVRRYVFRRRGLRHSRGPQGTPAPGGMECVSKAQVSRRQLFKTYL